ncbi:Gti1/Pac2 family-domain-containing protein [Aspergillus californicus]
MVNSSNSTALEPTFEGYVATTRDALMLFEACLGGVLSHVPRRPHDRERSSLVRSGCVFIYEENSSGIKRWTDGVTWSPSRILGNFLVYRELEKPFPPGEKKRAMKKTTRRPPPPGRPGEPYPRHDSNGGYPPSPVGPSGYGDRPQQNEMERALVGSLVDSYGFKDNGLVKKTMSVTVSGVAHHLVSYYSMDDVMFQRLVPPSSHEVTKYLRPRPELTLKQSFRSPIDDAEVLGFEGHDPTGQLMYRSMIPPPSYGMNPQTEYYAAPQNYVPSPMHPPQQHPHPLMAFPVNASPLPSQQPQAYLPMPTSSTHLPKQEEYSPYRGQPAYAPGYEHLPHNNLSSSMHSGMSLSSSISERARSQSDQSQSVYRNSSMSSRSVGTDATSPLDSSTPGAPFRASTGFSMAPQMDGTPQPPPLEHRHLSYDATVPRRESNMSAPYYPGNERPQFYTQISATHSAYPVGAWNTASPAQPQI